MIKAKLTLAILSLVVLSLFLTGCDLVPLHMRDQPKYGPLEESRFFPNEMAARPVPAHTIPRGKWGRMMLNEHLYTGQIEGEFTGTFPMPVTPALMARGQDRYNIYCSPCHDRAGYGNGMIVQRGFQQPSSFHIDRLREQPAGYYYDAIANGFGAMYSYGARLDPQDRWAVVAYIRALQRSQNATPDDVPESEQPKLE
ncbi:MAG: cytochrome c [Anaerolineae bacterium]|nr:cytochrome c [Anaerolineae bacterium]